MTIIIAAALLSPQSSKSMGLNYFIFPNKETECAGNFGDGLSFFFEQVGGYGETAEVEQVSRILNINLSVFQDVGYDEEDNKEIDKHWLDIDSLSRLLDTFSSKINAKPDYHKQVIHNPDWQKNREQEIQLSQIKDSTEFYKQHEALQKQPLYFYPPDFNYLSDGRLLKDLQILKQTFECYKRSGVTKVRLQYM